MSKGRAAIGGGKITEKRERFGRLCCVRSRQQTAALTFADTLRSPSDRFMTTHPF